MRATVFTCTGWYITIHPQYGGKLIVTFDIDIPGLCLCSCTYSGRSFADLLFAYSILALFFVAVYQTLISSVRKHCLLCNDCLIRSSVLQQTSSIHHFATFASTDDACGIVTDLKCLTMKEILNTIPSNLFSSAKKRSRAGMDDTMEHLPEE